MATMKVEIHERDKDSDDSAGIPCYQIWPSCWGHDIQAQAPSRKQARKALGLVPLRMPPKVMLRPNNREHKLTMYAIIEAAHSTLRPWSSPYPSAAEDTVIPQIDVSKSALLPMR